MADVVAMALAPRRLRLRDVRQRRRGARGARRARRRRRRHRLEDAGHGRPRAAAPAARPAPEPAGHPAHRARQRALGRRRDARRRLRLRDQAVRQRRAARGGGARPRADPARARESLPPPGGREPLRARHRWSPRARAAQDLLALVRRVAPSRSTVLIQGESGTGKELVARLLHYWSDRVGQPFVAVNCKAFAEGVLESELFGHEKGAFTGALGARRAASSAPAAARSFSTRSARRAPTSRPSCCACCRRARCFRVGATRRAPSTCASSPRPTARCATRSASGRFREDLFFRLNVIPLQLPPLRERREDILPLARHFLARHAAEAGRTLTLVGGRRERAARALLAGQRARARERHRARRRPGARRRDHARGSAARAERRVAAVVDRRHAASGCSTQRRRRASAPRSRPPTASAPKPRAPSASSGRRSIA